MNITAKTFTQIPPIAVISGDKITIGGSARDIHSCLQTENIRRSNAFIVHDPCGCLKKRYRGVLERHGYRIKTLDTTCGAVSARYNPFSYIRDNGGVTELADAVIRGTSGNSDSDDYGFLLTEWLLLKTIFGYIHENALDYEKNFDTALEMLKSMEIIEGLEDSNTPVDYMMDSLEGRDPFNSTVLRYRHYKTTPYAKDNRILESCAERLAPLVTKQALDLMSEDELCFDEWSYCNTALFVRTDVNCPHLEFLTPLMYSQFFSTAYEQAVK